VNSNSSDGHTLHHEAIISQIIYLRLRFGQNEANLLLPLCIQKLKGFQLQGALPPYQGLCPWALVGALPPDPLYRLALTMPRAQAPQT